MVEVGQGGNRRVGVRRQALGPRVLEASAFVAEHAEGREQQEVGLAVVVQIARDRGAGPDRGEARRLGHVGESSGLVAEEPNAARSGQEQVELTVAERVHEHGPPQAATAADRGGKRGVVAHERDRGRGLVHEIRLGAGRGQGFRVSPLLQVGLAELRLVEALPQLLEALRDRSPFVAPTRAGERHAEVVGRGDVVGLGTNRGLEERDGVVVAPLLEEHLAEVHAGPDVRRVLGPHVPEVPLRVFGPVLLARDEPKHVGRLGCRGRESGRPFGFAERRLHVGHVQKADREVDLGLGKLRVQGHRLLELLDAVREPILLEERHPQVVGAVRGLARRQGGARGRPSRPQEAQAQDTRHGEHDHGKKATRQDHPAIVSGTEAGLKAARDRLAQAARGRAQRDLQLSLGGRSA